MYRLKPIKVGGGYDPVSDKNPAGTVTISIGKDNHDATFAKAEQIGAKTDKEEIEIPGVG